VGKDVAIATTCEPLPPSIPVYALPQPVDEALAKAQLPGRSAISATWSADNRQPDPKGVRIVGVRAVAAVFGTSVRFRAAEHLDEALYFPAVSGDSGNPVFFLHPESDRLILISTYTTGGGGGGPFYGSRTIQDLLETAIRSSPAPGEKLRRWDMERGQLVAPEGRGEP
jgi:hypothetical protein